jgi:sulfatase maturation enzyme AslB (radical SAM superfamily)
MCAPVNSNRFDKEVKENTSLQQYFRPMETSGEFTNISQEQIKNIAKNLDTLYLTGGEPMLIKEYHDILDYLIENNHHKKIMLQITTNGSVFNPKLMEKIVQFKSVRIVLSIDGIGDVADYQRHGSTWATVKENLYSYLNTPKIEIVVNSVCSAYTILDIVNLVDFLIETRREYRDFNWSLWRAITPTQINFSLLNKDLTARALEQVQMSLTKLLSSEFNDQFFLPGIKELKSYTLELEKNNYLNFDDFVQFTDTLDRSRNESFEQVFGYKIY